MTKDELKEVIKSNVHAWHNYDAVLTAVDAYSKALIAAKPNVSGSGCLDWIHEERVKINGDNFCPICGKTLQAT